MQCREVNKGRFLCPRLPHEGDAADKGVNQTQQYLLVRYATQAPDPIIERNIAREVTEKDRW